MRSWWLLAPCAVLFLPGCSPSSHDAAEDLTRGRLVAVSSPDAVPAIERCRQAFERLYPHAHIELRAGTSREAIAALFGARADLAVISRELVPEERRAAVQGKLEIDGYRFARDAAVLMVNPANPITNLTREDVRAIYSGKLRNWSALGGRDGPIESLVPPAGSDLMEFFAEEVMEGEPIGSGARTVSGDSEAVRVVTERPGAIAVTTLGAVLRGGKPLQLAALRGLAYYKPDPEMVHDGRYPVTRFYNLYVRARGPALANGFITFVTSMDGQRLIRSSGLVPTSVPVRFVRRSPMLGTHSQGDSTSTP
jgi:phosphate transport system substrate-binding protein